MLQSHYHNISWQWYQHPTLCAVVLKSIMHDRSTIRGNVVSAGGPGFCFLSRRRSNEALLLKLTVTLSVRTEKCIDLGPFKYILSLNSVTMWKYPQTEGTAVAQWLGCCATHRKVDGSIPAGVIGIFH